jgi:hypothetical protein
LPRSGFHGIDRLSTVPQGRLGSVNVGPALLIAVLVLALGGLLLAVLYAQFRVMKDGPAQLGQRIPGARRRAVLAGLALTSVLVIEVALFLVGRSAGGPALGGGLAVAGIIVVLVVGFVLAVRDDTKRRSASSV